MIKKICNFFSGLLLIILAILAGLLILPKLFGYESMAVLTGSMEPKYPVGSLIYVKEADPKTLVVGDVITYHISENTVVTHRIVEVNQEEQQVITKGDANNNKDANPVKFSSIVGKANFNIPYLGFIAIYAKTPIGIGVICCVLVLIILLTFLPDVLSKDEEDDENKKTENKEKNIV